MAIAMQMEAIIKFFAVLLALSASFTRPAAKSVSTLTAYTMPIMPSGGQQHVVMSSDSKSQVFGNMFVSMIGGVWGYWKLLKMRLNKS